MENLEQILQGFKPITLSEMDGVQLMDRTDTKFMLSRGELEDILKALPHTYRVLEVNGIRQSHYETLYYDTEDFHHFILHQNGKRNRYKIRMRKYVDSDLTFLEVKFKSNRERTIKNRMKLPEIGEVLEEKSMEFLGKQPNLDENKLVPKIWNAFKRITLVNEELKERLTIDCELSFRQNGSSVLLPKVVIAEVKQERANRHSPFMVEVKRRMIRPESISKYCLGVALLFPHVKSNNFKQKILKIKRLENGMAA